MKLNRNQALYKALPNSWISFSRKEDSRYKYSCKVTNWNIVEVNGIYKEKIVADIVRRINSFKIAGGDIGEFSRNNLESSFFFCEASINPEFGDIKCEISPALFYCNHCGKTLQFRSVDKAPTCNCTGSPKLMRQLAMIYACECGHAEGVFLPKSNSEIRYLPRIKEENYKWISLENGSRRLIDMNKKCSNCGKFLRHPYPATDKRTFYPQSGKAVNLYNVKLGELLRQYKEDTYNLLFAKWLGIVGIDEFNKIIKKPEPYFSEDDSLGIDEEIIQRLMKRLSCDRAFAISMLSDDSDEKVDARSVGVEINQLLFNGGSKELLGSNLLEYDTVLYPESKITYEEAVEKAIATGHIMDSQELNEMVDKLGIKFTQISQSVKIVNYSYGYTRLSPVPSMDGKKFVLKSFGAEAKNNVFTSILETEGLLIEFDRKKIYDWLVENFPDDIDNSIEDEKSEKLFFINKIDVNIPIFSSINPNDKITKAVYSLIHTMSHMFIQSAGINSGLSKDSLSEIIFPNIPAVFIYPTTIQGISLGSISGMYETKFLKFLQDAIEMNEICTLDPICMETQNGACMGCSYISDVSCTHFNKDLSRAYLYGGKVVENGVTIEIKKGFWK